MLFSKERVGRRSTYRLCEDTPAAFALFFHNLSTFLGGRGARSEGLYMELEYTGEGLGASYSPTSQS
jgi:hypothetical protein